MSCMPKSDISRQVTTRMFVDGDMVRRRWRRDRRGDQPGHRRIARPGRAGRPRRPRAIAAANAFGSWAARTGFERAELLHRAADACERRRDELARILTLDQGKPLKAEAEGEVGELIEFFHMAAEDGKRLTGTIPEPAAPGRRVLLLRRPLGTVGLITPWNWPYTMPAEVLALALACGNCVVWTPAPSTAVCSGVLAECIAEADLPPGVFNMVLGPGRRWATSWPPTRGRAPWRSPAPPRPASPSPSARPARRSCSRWAATGRSSRTPTCRPPPRPPGGRLPRRRAELLGGRAPARARAGQGRVRAAGRAGASEVRLGDPLDDATTMGPVNNEPGAAKMDAHVADAVERGARVVTGGSRATASRPLYWEPTVLDDVPPDSIAVTAETFGPIAPIVGSPRSSRRSSRPTPSPTG